MFTNDDIVYVEPEDIDSVTTGAACASCAARHPAPQSNGNLQVDPEIHLPSPGMDVDISYFYNSWVNSSGSYGYGRTISTNLILVASADTKTVKLIRGDGASVTFVQFEPGRYGKAGKKKRANVILDPANNVWVETGKKGIKTYYQVVPDRHEAKVSRIVDTVGNCHTYSYDAKGLLATLTDTVGRQVQFRYNIHDLLSEIVDWASRKTTFEYDMVTNPKKPVMIKATGPTGCQTSYRYDPDGFLTGIVDPNGYETNYRYNADRRVCARAITGVGETKFDYDFSHINDQHQYTLVTTDALGNKTTEVYTANNQLVSMTSPMGRVEKTERKSNGGVIAKYVNGKPMSATIRDVNGNIVTRIDAQGLKTHYTFDQFGNQTSETLPNGVVTKQIWGLLGSTFDETGEKRRLQVEIDAYGNKTTHTYNAFGQRTSTKDVYEGITSFAYDQFGNLVSKIAPAGAKWTMKYDAAGNVIETIAPDGGVARTEYDARNRPTEVTDPMGNVTRMAYDGNGNNIVVIDALKRRWAARYNVWDKIEATVSPMGRVTRRAYDKLGRMVAKTDALGNCSTTDYDADGKMIASRDSLGRKTAYNYDDNGRRVNVVDPLGNQSQTLYDELGRSIGAIDALGNRSTTIYDKLGEGSVMIDASGNKTTTLYDEYGRQSGSIDALGNKVRILYDKFGRLETVADSLGNVRLVYDNYGRISSSVDPLGRENKVEYDALDRRSSIIDASGIVRKFEFDLNGRIAETVDGLGNVTRTVYDGVGQRVALINANGAKTIYAFDGDGRQISETNDLGYTTRFTYDDAGNRTAVADANGNRSTFAFDACGQKVSETDAAGKVTKYEYDSQGNLTRTAYANADSVQSKYDSLRHEIERNLSTGALYSFAYDPNGNRISEIGLDGTTLSEYDAVGHLVKVTLANGKTLVYKYNARGQRVEMLDVDAGKTTYGYDQAGRQTSISNPHGETTTFEYDDASLRTATHHPNGVTMAKQVDASGREIMREEVASDGKTVSAFFSTYDKAGNRLTLKESDGTLTQYNYDATGQIVAEIRSGGEKSWNIEYQYDPTGNRASKLENDEETKYHYGPCNELLEETPQNGPSRVFVYDDCIRPLSSEDGEQVTKRLWDAGGRLIAIHLPDGTTETNEYNADGIRVAKAVGSAKSMYILDGVNVISEVDGSGKTVASWTHADTSWGKLLAEHRNGATYIFSFDPSSNTRYLTDSTGTVVAQYLSDAFGVDRGVAEKDQGTPQRFAGEYGYWHDGGDRYYVRARHLDTGQGRWLTRDPLNFDGGDWNLLRYVGNRTVHTVDPSGLCPKCHILTCRAEAKAILKNCIAGIAGGCSLKCAIGVLTGPEGLAACLAACGSISLPLCVATAAADECGCLSGYGCSCFQDPTVS